jgi:mxaL protein
LQQAEFAKPGTHTVDSSWRYAGLALLFLVMVYLK